MKFLVTGGAGYVGSHFVAEAVRQGHECLVVDNLCRGHRQALPDMVELVVADIRDRAAIQAVVESFRPEVLLHYAAFALVAESVAQPELYHSNNVEGTASLLETLAATSPIPVVLSSSCTVYGEPKELPLREGLPMRPMSPYGESKVACERLIAEYTAAHQVGSYALRYFNACGADPSGRIGEDHEPETHLIPNIMKAILSDKKITIFGSDFPTHDGTCVRDYIHVSDLAKAHLAACAKLQSGERTHVVLNLGVGKGYSNLEILAAVERVVGAPVKYAFGDRRAGDPPELYADPSRARKELAFTPDASDLDTILNSAWRWHQAHPEGYR